MTLEKLTTAYLKRERLLAANEVGKFHDLLVHELFCSRDANSISNTVGNANRPRTHEQAARTANTIQPSSLRTGKPNRPICTGKPPSQLTVRPGVSTVPYARASHRPLPSTSPPTNRPHTHGQAVWPLPSRGTFRPNRPHTHGQAYGLQPR